MEDSPETIIIDNDEKALEVLADGISGKLDDDVVVEFRDWPVLHIKLEGKDFRGTIPTRIMYPILDLQKEVNKVYCRAKYGTDNTLRLTDYERERLELIVKVNEGSSEYFADLVRSFSEIVKDANMTGKEVAIIVISVGILYTSNTAWSNWLAHQEKLHQMDQTVQLSKQAVRQQELIAEAINNNTELLSVAEGANNVKNEFARRLKPSDKINIGGQQIVDGDHAGKVVRSVPVEPEDIRIDDIFVITEVAFPQELGQPYKLSVKRVTDKMPLTIEASHAAINDEQIETIKTAGFGIKRVFLSINAKKKNEKIYNAKLVRISLNIKKPDEA